MAVEIFIAPMVGDGTRENPFRAKYTDDAAVTASGSIRSSKQDECVVLIQAPQAYLDSVAANSDVLRIATQANIDSTLSNAQATAAKSFVEARNIPGDFINNGDTRRHAIRAVCGMFLFCQRMEGRFGVAFKKRAIDAGITLATQFQSFPQAVRDEFTAIRDEHGWNNLGLTNSSTLRQILVAVSQQFELQPLYIAGFQI